MAVPKKPSSPPSPSPVMNEERILSLAEDCLRIVVNSVGGFTRGGEEDVRQIVRMIRVMHSEMASPTKPKAASSRRQDEDEDEI